MKRRTPEKLKPQNPLGPATVFGLEGGREVARRRQRRQQVKDKIISTAGAIVGIGFLAAVGYVGYTFYNEQQASDRIESDERRAQWQSERSGNDLSDAIVEIEESPRWNGPGNPSFGVGDDDG